VSFEFNAGFFNTTVKRGSNPSKPPVGSLGLPVKN